MTGGAAAAAAAAASSGAGASPLPASAAAAPPAAIKRVCVFCGARHGARPSYATAARSLGSALVGARLGLVYGGGTVGLMGEVARVVDAGLGPGGVLGVIPAALTPREVSAELIGDTRVVGDMHERKAMMAAHADAFIALPGGFGTLEELLEVMTWQQLGFHAKPIGLLNIDGFFTPLLDFFGHCIDQGFVSAQHQNLLVSDDPQQLLADMQAWTPPASNVLRDAQARKAAIGQDVSQASDAADP